MTQESTTHTLSRTPIADLSSHIGQTVRVAGVVYTVRDQKKMQFIVLQDRTGSVQVVHEKSGNDPHVEHQISGLTIGSAVSVTGTLIQNSHVKLGGMELVLQELKVESVAAPELPVSESSGLETQMNWRYLALRRPENRLLFEIQTTAEQAMREFWASRQFIEIHSPKLMHSASESGAETFSLDYFDLGKAYLAQSPQFYKQMAMAAGFERVFEIGPVFRAEPSFTARHATEFTSVDVEMSWIDSHEDVMRLEEEWLAFVLKSVVDQHGPSIERHLKTNVKVPTLPFPRITMAAAHALLRDLNHTVPAVTKAGDIDPEGERILARHFAAELDHEFFFLTDYPVTLRPFYHMRYPEQPHLTKSFDLMWKGTEITTGAQREHRYDVLSKQAEEAGLRNSVEYYIDFFKYGCPPHGGFGFGLSRMLMLMLNTPSIREVTFLHRGPQRLTP